MIFQEPLEDVVRRRYSVRTYNKVPMSETMKEDITAYFDTLDSPFPSRTSFSILEAKLAEGGAKLGTYGMIKAASVFIIAKAQKADYGVEALGYEFEQLILYLTTLGLGTCWLGGTFNRAEFNKALGESVGTFIPAISPVGYFEKKSLRETIVRGVIHADTRKPWDALFFDGGFDAPLSKEQAGAYAFALEMVRLGPSASNKQPWRIVREADRYHFFEQKTPGYSKAFPFDMQSIDMGIAACHFHLAAKEKGLDGQFSLDAAPALAVPDNTVYKFSWITA